MKAIRDEQVRVCGDTAVITFADGDSGSAERAKAHYRLAQDSGWLEDRLSSYFSGPPVTGFAVRGGHYWIEAYLAAGHVRNCQYRDRLIALPKNFCFCAKEE